MRCKPRMVLVIAVIGLSSACAHQSARVYSAAARPGASAADVVTASDLASGGGSRSVFTALQQARPSFLGRGGGLPAVSLDGSLVTDVSILGMLSVSDVCEIRLQRATSGAGHPVISSNGAVSNGDLLLVRTRKGTIGCGRDSVSERRSPYGASGLL